MSLDTRPRSVTAPRQRKGGGNVVSDDLSAAFIIDWPRTERAWAAWRLRRRRYALAICRWALDRARARSERAGRLFHVERAARAEAIEMVRTLGLTRADTRALEEKYRNRNPGRNGKRARGFRDKRSG